MLKVMTNFFTRKTQQKLTLLRHDPYDGLSCHKTMSQEVNSKKRMDQNNQSCRIML